MKNDPRTTPRIWLAGAAIAVSLTATVLPQSAGPRTVDTFTATTANMTPAGLDLRMQVLAWQDADARAAVVATLMAGDAADPPLAKLPTVGYIWPAQSPVGYSVKYAQRAPLPNGGERITLVTDKRLGSYDFRGWSVSSPAPGGQAPYSVIELDLSDAGGGTGNLSLAAEVRLDEQAGTVSLADGGAPSLLTNVKREPSR
jgi:hypothetical protein